MTLQVHRPSLAPLCLLFAAASPALPADELSRLIYMRDLAKEPGVVEISSPSAFLGRGATPAGDVDGDRLDDVLIAAAAVGVEVVGAVVLLYGQPGLPSQVDPLQGEARVTVVAGVQVARSTPVQLAGGHDVNGDGLDDFLIGEGAATFVVLGSRSLPERFNILDVGTGVAGTTIAFPRSQYFGVAFLQTAALGGDVNGDGLGEILLGDPEWEPGAPGKGRVHVIFGQRTLPGTISLDDIGGKVPGFVIAGSTPDGAGPTGDGLGLSVGTVGDVDGDGLDDLGLAGNSCFKGSYLVFGRLAFPPVIDVLEIPGALGTYFEAFSGSMHPMGDWNGDGHGDFTLQFGGQITGVPNPELAGRYDLVVVAGRPRGELPAVVTPAQLLLTDPTSVILSDSWESICPARLGLAAGVDVDRDGRSDLLFARDDVTVIFPERDIGRQEGLVYFVPLSSEFPHQALSRDLRSRWGFWLTGEANDRLGASGAIMRPENGLIPPGFQGLGLLHDFNGNGQGELLLTAPHTSESTVQSRCYNVPVQAITDPPLEVAGVSPAGGSTSGGDVVDVNGRGVAFPGTRVFFGGAEAEVVGAKNQATLLVRTPPGPAGGGVVDVSASRGQRSSVLRGAFHYRQTTVVDVSDIANGTVAGGELFTATRLVWQGRSGPAGIEGLEAVKDVNGDGTDDIIIYSSFGEDGDRLSVVFGGPHRDAGLDFLDTQHGFTLEPRAQGVEDPRLSRMVGSGDVDGDGVGDFAVSTYLASTSYLYVVYGGPALPPDAHPASFPRRTRITGSPGNTRFRIVEDLDGGGHADLVEVAGEQGVRSCEGHNLGVTDGVWVLSGEDLRERDEVAWDELRKLRLRTPFHRVDDVQTLDANGDGRADLVLQAKLCSSEGVIVIFGGESFGAPGEIIIDDDFLEDGKKGVAVAGRIYTEGYPSLGFTMAASSDLDGDGGEELVVGSPFITGTVEGKELRESGEAYVLNVRQASGPGPNSPEARVWAAHVGLTPISLLDPALPRKGVLSLQGPYADRRLGHAVAGAGDFNGDGTPDLAIGAGTVLVEDSVPNKGLPYTYVLLGKRDLLEGRNDVLARETFDEGILVRGAGYHLDGGRDVNGDGHPDLLAAGHNGSVYVLFGGPGAGKVRFRRGDANLDDKLDLSDAIVTLGYLFQGAGRPRCLAAADVDDGGIIDITDAIGLLGFLFRSGTPPRPPFPEPGLDPTPDDLGCADGESP